MTSTLALIKKEQLKKPEETEEDYKDRMIQEAFWKLREKEKRTKKEQEEYKDLQEKYVAYLVVKKGGLSQTITDVDLRSGAARLYKELTAENGEMTALKRLLLDRLVSAWSMAASYERLFQFSKYKIDMSGNDPQLTYTQNLAGMKIWQETRKGIEVANDQIIRLSQALRNLSAPPLQVNAKNAYFAQNQQINNDTSETNNAKASP